MSSTGANGCPIVYYTECEAMGILEDAGFSSIEVISKSTGGVLLQARARRDDSEDHTAEARSEPRQ